MPQNHRQNTNFQIAHFLAGKCHTPDGAYAMLCDLREERQRAVNHYHVSQVRQQAEELRARAILDDGNEYDRLLAEATLLEIENGKADGEIHYQAALDELAFIDACIAKVRPLRQYKDLPDAEAHEAAQQEEWKRELIFRAENFLATQGFIPADQFATMRSHPEFENAILPRIQGLQETLKIKGIAAAQKELESVPRLELGGR